MREIKFRAFNENRQGKYTDCSYSNQLFPHLFWESIYKGIFDRGPDQYIGIKDKNGKELYENDIVSFNYHNDRYDDTGELNNDYRIGKIIFSNEYGCAAFVILFIEDEKEWKCQIIDNLDIELIGNVYENPELLKGIEND